MKHFLHFVLDEDIRADALLFDQLELIEVFLALANALDVLLGKPIRVELHEELIPVSHEVLFFEFPVNLVEVEDSLQLLNLLEVDQRLLSL